MEEALDGSPYLAGDAYSLADAAVTPYVFRAEMLGLEQLWLDRRPRVRARPSFEQAITGVLTEADNQRLRVAREESWPAAREILGIG